MWVRSLGSEEALEEGMAIHSSILAQIIPWTEEPGGLQSMGLHRGRHDLAHTYLTILLIVLGLFACFWLQNVKKVLIHMHYLNGKLIHNLGT